MTVIGQAEIDVQANTSRFVSGMTAGLGGVTSTVARLGGAITGAFAVGRIVESIGHIGIAYQDSLNTFSAVADKAQLKAAGGLKAVGDAATKLGNDLTLPNTSAADAANAMTELAKAGLSVNDTMRAAKGTLQLAAAGSLDEADAAKITANALNTFHLAGTRATDVANTLANAANVSSGEVTDFAQALAQGGLMARQVGLNIHETAGALALFANNGLQGSDAGTSLKTMLQRLEPQTTKAAGAMKNLGLDFTDAHGKFLPLDQVAQQLHDHLSGLTQAQRTSALYTIFGSDAIRAATLLYDAGGKGVDKYTTAVSKAGGAAAIAAAKSQGLGGALRGMQSQLETLGLQIFQDVAPSLESLVRNGSQLMPVISDLAHVAGQVLGPALGIAGTALSDVAGVVGDVAGFFEHNKTAATALAAALTVALIPAATRAATVLAWRGLNAGAQVILAMISAVGRLRAGLGLATAEATTFGGTLRAVGSSAIVGKIGLAALAFAAFNAFNDIRAGNTIVNKMQDVISKPIKSSFFASLQSEQSALNKSFDESNHKGENFFGHMASWVQHPVQTFNDALGRTGNALNDNQAAIDAAYGGFNDLVNSLHRWPTPQAQEQTALVLTKMGLSAKDLGTKDFPGLLAKVQDWIAANKASHNPAEQAANDITALGSGAQSAADDVKALTSALDLLAGDALSADQQTIAFRNDIDVLDKALRKSHGSLDLSSKAARDARDAFDSAAQQAISAAEAQAKLKNGTDRARSTLQSEIQTLKDHAGNSDYAKAAIGRLTNALDQLPGAAAKATGALNNAGGAAKTAGKNIGFDFGHGLVIGLAESTGAVEAQASKLAMSAAAAAKLAHQSRSPSRVAMKIGRDFGDGLALGIIQSSAGVLAATTKLSNAASSQVALGLSNADVENSITRSMRSQERQAQLDRNNAVAALGRAQQHLAAATAQLATQTDIYKPLRLAANAAAKEVKHLQDQINAEEHQRKPNEARIKELRREQDAAKNVADQTAKTADAAQKGFDKATAASKKWSDAVQADSKTVSQAQRALADAFRQEQVDAASAILDALSTEVDALTAKADSLRNTFQDAVQAGTSLSAVLQTISQAATTDANGDPLAPADPVATYIGTLQTTLANSTALASDIGTLVGEGLNDSTVQEIIKLGPAAGDAFAQSLLAAGPDAINSINTLINGIGDVATHGMDEVAKQLYGPGAAVLESLIDGIKSGFPELDATIATINAKLATIASGNAAVAAATSVASTSAAAGTAKSVTIAPVTNVTVTGSYTDSEAAALEKWSRQHNASLVQLAQTGVK